MREHEHFITITTPAFTAGIVMLDDGCVRAPEVLKWCLGKSRTWIRAEFARLGYTATSRKILLGEHVSLGGPPD